MKGKKALLRLGLQQIPKRDLRRLKSYLESGKPILLNGDIYEYERGYG